MDFKNWDTILAGYEGDPYRRFVMIPTIVSLLPDLHGKKILDVGCGNGILIPHLLKKGAASVTGIDMMPHLLKIARDRLPENVTLHTCNVTQPFKIPEAPFDGAVSNFVLHELKDIRTPMQHVFDVLKPGAFFILGVIHPTLLLGKHIINGSKDIKNYKSYFSGAPITDTYRDGGESIDFDTFTYPLSAYVNTAIDVGFSVKKICEPETTAEVIAANPTYYADYRDLPVSVYFLMQK